jgi:hypothetical protein
MPLKKRIYKFLCTLCALTVLLSSITLDRTAFADEPVGKMSAVYGYVLNDYLATYGAISTSDANGAIYDEEGGVVAPTGVVYGDVVNFDDNENPYLVIYITEGIYKTASCHIWKYNEEKEVAERIAILEKEYDNIDRNRMGEFNLGWNDEKRYITYKEYEDNNVVSSEYYTVIDGDALMYVNNPTDVYEAGIMDFNAYYFHPGIDVSNYNQTLNNFFDSLKNAAADSVTYEDIAERLTSEDEVRVEAVLAKAVSYENFDIDDYDSIDEYQAALNEPTNSDRFYLISNMYNLGDEIYYVRFSTDKSYYNYALLRRSDTAENGYQILRVSTDCIPLADRELKQLKEAYSRNTLLYKKSKGYLKLQKKVKEASGAPEATKTPQIIIDKMIDSRMRIPAACIGGGIAIAFLTILWVFLYGGDE